MKRSVLLFLAVIAAVTAAAALCVTKRAEKGIRTFEPASVSYPKAEREKTLKEKTFDLSGAFESFGADSYSVLDERGYIARFAAWKGSAFHLIDIDVFGGDKILRDIDCGDHDIFLKETTTAETTSLCFADFSDDGRFDIGIFTADTEAGYSFSTHAEYGKCNKVCSLESDKLPFCIEFKGKLYLSTYDRAKGDTLYCWDGSELTEIVSFRSKYSSKGYKGEALTALGSGADYLYAQVSEARNEPLEEAKTRLIALSPAGTVEGVWKMDEAYDFIGTAGRLIAQKYAFPDPEAEIGRIIDLDESSVVILPDIQSGNSMYFAESFGDDTIIGAELSVFMIVDDDNVQTVRGGEGLSGICVGDNGALCLLEGTTLHMFFQDSHYTDSRFLPEEAEALDFSLFRSNASLIKRTEDRLIYCESSEFDHIPMQGSDVIIWSLDKKTGECSQLASFTAVIWRYEEKNGGLAVIGDEKEVLRITLI